MTDQLTVILPCAGDGSRLGLPIPKELASIPDGRLLIDSSLDVIRLLPDSTRVLIVAGTKRELTIQYVQTAIGPKSLAVLPAQPCTTQRGLASTLEYAAPWLTNRNLLLFPDQVFECPSKRVANELVAELETSPICFLHRPMDSEQDAERISNDGALSMKGQYVTGIAEKPRDATAFNAVWVATAFTTNVLAALIQLFDGQPDSLESLVRGCRSWAVDYYANVNSPADLSAVWGQTK